MSHDDDLDEKLAALAELPVPPPSAALLGMVRAGGAVTTRSPWHAVAAVVAVAITIVVVHTWVTSVREDLASLPPTWFYAVLAAWLLAFLAPLAVALVPRRGSVLADSGRAALLALVIPAAVTAMSIWLRVDGPQTVIPTPDNALRYIASCILGGLEMAAIPLIISIVALYRAALPSHTRWLGAAVGAANGSLAGLMLHVHCPIGGPVHVAVGHAGASIVGAIVGAIVVPTVRPRRSATST